MVCSNPPSVQNGGIDEDQKFTFEEELKIICDRGFTLTESTPVVCQEDGEWSARRVECSPVVCEPHNSLSHREVEYSQQDLTHGVIQGGQAHFSCSQGFTLQGAASASCLPDGTWSAKPPQCQSKTPQTCNTNSLVS